MPHEMIDEIQSRKGEKVALFLTFENAAGLILGVLPAFLLSAAMPWWLRFLVVGAAGSVGVLATLEVGGMAFYERMLWAARGWIAQRTNGDRVTPEQLIGAKAIGRRDRALPIGGPVRLISGAGDRSRHGRSRPALERTPASRPDPATLGHHHSNDSLER